MKRLTAQHVLLRYRPGTSDDQDPEIIEALRLARAHPDLQRWLQQHLAFQHSVTRHLQDLPLPPGLEAQILSERTAALSPPAFSRRHLLAAATALALLLGTVALLLRPPRTDPETRFATFRSRMVRTALRGYAMDLTTESLEDIRTQLARRPGLPHWQLPPNLLRRPLLGCATLTWQGQPAAMICFGSHQLPDLWLFVVRRTTLPDPPSGPEPRLLQVNRLNTASWSHADATYVLAGDLDDRTLRLLVGRAL